MRTGEASWSIISEVSALRLPHRALDIELSGTSPRGAAMDRFCTNWAPLEWRGAAAKDKAFRMAWTRSEEVDVLLERVESSGDDEARPLLERLAELTTIRMTTSRGGSSRSPSRCSGITSSPRLRISARGASPPRTRGTCTTSVTCSMRCSTGRCKRFRCCAGR